MIRAWKTTDGIVIQREFKKPSGVKNIYFTIPIPKHEIESFFEAIYPFYREHISKNVSTISTDIRPVGVIADPSNGTKYYYISLDTYIMLCDDTPGRPNKPDITDTRALTRLVSFNGDECDIRTALAVSRRRGMQGIAAMISFTLDDQKEKEHK